MENVEPVDKKYHKFVSIGIFGLGFWFLIMFILSEYVPGFSPAHSLGISLRNIIPAVFCLTIGGVLLIAKKENDKIYLGAVWILASALIVILNQGSGGGLDIISIQDGVRVLSSVGIIGVFISVGLFLVGTVLLLQGFLEK